MAVQITLTFSVPTQKEIDDFCAYHQWTAESGETKAAFAKRKVIEFFRESIKAKRATDAQTTVRQAEITKADTLNIS